jgi:sphinganine-1-phosphate aldolase
MAVTRPQTQAGVVERWSKDLADAVDYALAHRDEPAKSGAIYGGVAGGMSAEADEFIRAVMADMMDQQASVPPA